MTDYRTRVVESISEEYETYRRAELQEEPEQIFEDCHHIFFNREVSDFLVAEDNDLDDKDYKYLCKSPGSILSLLWDFYLHGDSSAVTTWDEIRELINDYNENCSQLYEAEAE